MLAAMGAMGGGGLSAPSSAAAEGYQTITNDIQTGFGGIGSFTGGNYHGAGSKSSVNEPLNIWVLAGAGFLVAIWLLKKKK